MRWSIIKKVKRSYTFKRSIIVTKDTEFGELKAKEKTAYSIKW